MISSLRNAQCKCSIFSSLTRCRRLSSQASFRTIDSRTALTATAFASLAIGFAIGRSSNAVESNSTTKILPDGLPRTCCEHEEKPSSFTAAQLALPEKLALIAGADNVIDGRTFSTRTLPFLRGARLGLGSALCIVTPRNLAEVPELVQAIVDANCVIVTQGQNTGLTGGSVPREHDLTSAASSHRPTVVLSMKHLDRIFPIDNGDRVVCLAGAGLASLQQFLDTYFPDRESHSILGSTFLNPTTAAGVALGSGGTQMRKGPAYTERALYLKVTTNKWQENVVEVVNTLGIKGLQDRELPADRARRMDGVPYRLDVWSQWMTKGFDRSMKYSLAEDPDLKAASDVDYKERLCRHDSHINRYNADTRGPELNRSEGKVIILATVHDTFLKPKETKMFWLGFDTLETALAFRREVALVNSSDLPVSMEYLDRDAFDVIDQAGRIMGTFIKYLGTASPILRHLWNGKLWVEALPFAGATEIVDKLLYTSNSIMPPLLSNEIMETGRALDHHISLKVDEYGDGNLERLLDRMKNFASKHGRDKIVIHECSNAIDAMNAFRFVAAPAFRTWCVGNGSQGISVDYALPNNGGEAPLLDGHDAKPLKRMRYSHFGCNVVHEDLAYGAGVDVHAAKHHLKRIVEFECKGRLPAEHGHGTEYIAPPETQERWRKMDPLNVLNPGVGGLPDSRQYKA
ncbi:hypothetical protein MPSEU_000227300 [Mayamaea pseudoterrestris]|nr:hypothetical protein MPSEU_000227300 [Mayamaea pseudoterrestris]